MTLNDAPFMLKLLNDPIYHKFIGDRGVRTLEDCRKYLQEKVIDPAKRNGFGLCIVEVMDLDNDDDEAPGEVVGFCGLIKRDYLPEVDVGFAFASEHRGNGYATECASAVLDYARIKLKLKRIAGIVDPRNKASIAVLEKLGLKLKNKITIPGETTELSYYERDL